MDARDADHKWFSRFDPKTMKLIVEVSNDDGSFEEKEFPAKYEVCDTCEGRGSHVNPSIDSHGIGAEEWDRDWDEDDREAYFDGRYDVPCAECHGARVTPVLDEDRATPEERKQIEDVIEAHYASQREQDHERRMGY